MPYPMAQALLSNGPMRRLVAVLVLLSGCDLYWGGNSGDDICESDSCGCGLGGTKEVPVGLAQQHRNPDTGNCEDVGWGGCSDPCLPCAALVPPQQDWGVCGGSCDLLDESACLAATGCHAAYTENDGLAKPGTPPSFRGCWNVAPSGPVHGSCNGLSAYECSRHDDCSAMYVDTVGPADQISSTSFERCAPEPTSTGCAAVDCGPGSRCEEQCQPCGPNEDCVGSCQSMCVPESTCSAVDCADGYTCVEVCTGMGGGAGTSNGPPGQCAPSCVPIHTGDPGSCTGAITCFAPPPVCPAGTTAGISNGCYTGYCVPLADCGPHDPGTCDGAVCATPPPQCPANTVAGVKNGCWSGYCIPSDTCPVVACETLTSEASCSARSDCSPVYLGDDCTCYPGYCECNLLTYERCDPTVLPL